MKHRGKRLKNVTRLKNLFKNSLKLSHKTVLGVDLKDANVVKGNGDEAYSVTGVCVCEYVHQHTGEGKRLGGDCTWGRNYDGETNDDTVPSDEWAVFLHLRWMQVHCG